MSENTLLDWVSYLLVLVFITCGEANKGENGKLTPWIWGSFLEFSHVFSYALCYLEHMTSFGNYGGNNRIVQLGNGMETLGNLIICPVSKTNTVNSILCTKTQQAFFYTCYLQG